MNLMNFMKASKDQRIWLERVHDEMTMKIQK